MMISLGDTHKILLGCSQITLAKIRVAVSKNAPKIDPKGIKTVDSESLVPATIAVKTSGAAFANATKVTPAKVGDISRS